MNGDYHEAMNPYDGTCPKHGFWEGSHDECPQCMKEDYIRSEEDADHYNMHCEICKETYKFQDQYEGCLRYIIKDDYGSGTEWEDYDSDRHHHFCEKCYTEKIKPLFEG